MLNELYSLSQSLSRCGLRVTTKHKDLKKNRKTDGFILGIEEDGAAASIEFCCKERMEELWKIDSGENGVSFPGFKIAGPLWAIKENKLEAIEKLLKLKKDATTDRIALIDLLLENATFTYDLSDNKQRRYVKNNLGSFPKKIAPLFADCSPDFKILSDLLKRLTESKLSEGDFLRSLSMNLLIALRQGKLSAEAALLAQNLLIGKWESTNQKFGKSELTVVLEPIGGTQYPFAITHPKTEEFVNEQMNLKMTGKVFTKGGKGAESKFGVDSLCGMEAEIQTRLPDPVLPVIKKTIFMSMSSESRCQTRYGLQESAIFPVGKETAQVMLNALNFLTDETRKGKTWRGVPNSENGNDLLLVYLEDKPDSSANFADLFAADTNEDVVTEALFEATTAKICAAIEGAAAINPDSILRLIVLSSRDQGRQQVALNEFYTVKEILRSAEEWQIASANHPPISILLAPKKGEKPRIVAPACPPPAALLKCFNVQWTNEGTKSVWVSNCELGQVYEIFLRQSAQAQGTATRLLTLALQRNSNLLSALGNRQHGNRWSGFSDASRLAASTAISTFAILLFKTNHRKEEFMQQAPYNIGRLLSLADQLHALYCKEVRGDVPPQLFGNALMSTALQQPVTAISLFAQRVLPYWTWADTLHKGENIGLAKYFLKEMRSVSETLRQTELPTTLSEAERAQMILGYLASSKSEN
jgi:hypothetical protein